MATFQMKDERPLYKSLGAVRDHTKLFQRFKASSEPEL
jgi:hypothetical protein